MNTAEPLYVPCFRKEGAPDKCIFCLPLHYLNVEPEKIVLGAVTIDHDRENEFDGLTDQLKDVLSPYLRLLAQPSQLRRVFRRNRADDADKSPGLN